MNRKLIRPKLADMQNRSSQGSSTTTTTREFSEMVSAGSSSRRKQIPPEQTNAENFYYIKQMTSRTPVTVIMHDGEEITGVIEWYDRDCIKVNRDRDPNLVLMKRYIKYIFKERDRR